MKTVLLSIITLMFFQLNGQESMEYNKLTPEEERVILHKGTERPFSGKFDKHKEEGTYVCKRCGAELYHSSDKFNSGCGWPSFDDEIEGAVKRVPDADGRRTEIVCANCGGHLGHVFLGEGFTSKNTRHCVNSVSMDFIPAGQEKPKNTGKQLETAYFASGCFWGTEHFFNKEKGVKSTTVGYTGGNVINPSYEQVCTGKTGHAETVKVEYDPAVVSYEELARLFFETHDFTQVDRQGPDIGEQYRSVIFYTDENQKQTAENLVKTLEGKGYDVATDIEPATTFYDAEKYHQDYYQKTGGTPYCHFKREVF
ncbi:MAG: bifunctional methionine sulfoxide reductase B/A protein [Bacteroidales bacterium]